jgi:hypothetical protein
VAFPVVLGSGRNLAGYTWPAADVSARPPGTPGLYSIYVATNGSVPAVEQARTVLENAYPTVAGTPSTLGETTTSRQSVYNDYQQLADVVILVSLPIAGCTLAASVAAGLADRKRPFSLLRLTGAPLAVLRRVVVLEKRRPAPERRRGFHRHGLRCLRDVHHCATTAHARSARGRLLSPHRGRHRRITRYHRRHVPAVAAHHRPRGSQKRVTPSATVLAPHTAPSR